MFLTRQPLSTTSKSATHINQARASIQQALSWYSSWQRYGKHLPNIELQAAVRKELQVLKAAIAKLEAKVIRIAAFGLVSRGKSAVINALLGQKVLETGPIHGVTQWPRSIRWSPESGKVQIELIDTPGLDEIAGENRAKMAQEVVAQADLILFIVAGDLTRTEYQALQELSQQQKPLILVFNKIDLYPETDRAAIYQQLQQFGVGDNLQAWLSPEQIVMVAAEPQPVPIRIEWEDGQTAEEWETPPPQITQLKETILRIFNREGPSLLALNALLQAKQAQENIAKTTQKLRQEEAENIIWQYAQYKTIAVAINPIAIFDVVGGMVADLALIRSLAKLYGLPMTSYQAGKVWRKILFSSGGLLLGELASSLILGLGKTGAAVGSFLDSPANWSTYAGAALIQGSIAGYGAYTVGKVAQVYLANGCSWGSLGASTVIEQILTQIEPDSITYRFRQELASKLGH